MIESIEIQNFKSVGELQRIPFAPLTLLLGPNSAGKSSVMDALAAFAHVTRPPWASKPVSMGGRPQKIDLESMRRMGADESDPVILRVTNAGRGREFWGLEQEAWLHHPPDMDFRLIERGRVRGEADDHDEDQWPSWRFICDAPHPVHDFLRKRSYPGMTVGWRSEAGLSRDNALAKYYPAGIYGSRGFGGMFELWLDGRLLLMASPNAMSGGSASDERFAQPNLNNAGVLVLDPSHPFMRDHYEASDTCTELLHTEAGFEEGAAVDVFGFSRKALLDFSCDAEELLVLLHRHPFSPTVHLRDFDWTPEMVKQCLEEEKATGDDDGDWDCHDEILEMLDQGPYQSVNTDSGGVRFKVPSESSIGKMTRVIQSCLAIMAYQAAWIRKDLDQAMLVPSIRPKILSDIPLEDQADSMNDFGLSKDSKGLARAAPKAYRGVTRESLYEAGQWMEDPDRLALGVGITLEDRLEVDPEHPEFAKILRRGGSGKAISEAVEKSTRTLTFVRFKDLGTGASLEAAELGEGVSQVLPVACVALLDTINPYLRLMQQPELHLHPRIEARLADLLVYGMKKSRLHLSEDVARHSERILVETHSEHLILRICRRIRESTRGRIGAEVGLMLDELAVMGKSRTERDCSSDEEKRKFDSVIEDELATWIKPDDVAVIYAEPTPEGTVYHHLRIDEDGEFIDPWPDGFFPERAEELRP